MRNLIFIVLLIPIASFGQQKKKISYAKGTLFGYWGYNWTSYSKSDIRFKGNGYDFVLEGARAHDNPEAFNPLVYFNPSKLTIPQFNARVGYYYRNFWAISIGYDHMKYVFADRNEVNISGTVDPGVDPVLSGSYDSEPIITDRNSFHYENSDGLNYLRVELTHTYPLYHTGSKNQFTIAGNIGASTGALLSFNDFNFGGQKTLRTVSMSGYGMSLHGSIRFEFFRHFYLQPSVAGGFHHQVKVRTRATNTNSFAKHAYFYSEFNTVLGFFIYLRPTNSCDSCPVW